MIDNYGLWERHDYEQEKGLEKLPVCDYCRKTIQDDHYFDINGDIVCEGCLVENFRKNTEDYVE
jgi:hypothetical protein